MTATVWRLVPFLMVSLGVSGVGCGSTTGSVPGGSAAGSSGSGGSFGSSGPAPTTTAVCGRACSTDLAAASAALKAGDFARAFELYQCADSPEAAFGAGLTRTFLILEGSNATALLADFGQPPLPATDIFGADGLLSRGAARWQGEGRLTLSGGASLELTFDRGQQPIPEDVASEGFGRVEAIDWTTPHEARLTIGLGYPSSAAPELASGDELAVSFDCAATFPTRTIDPRLNYVDLSFDRDGKNHWCTLAYSSTDAECEPDGGSVVVTSAATLGAQATYTLRDLLLSCTPDSDDPALDVASYRIRVSGTVSALGVTETLDTTGLHPMFDAEASLDQIPGDRTGTDLIQHAGAAATELEEAACFFARAGQGSGTVFTLPGVLFGGADLPASKGDSQALAGLALLTAATAHLALAHDLDMPLNQLLCDAETSATPCLTDQEYVDAFNAAFASAFRPEGFETAERLGAEGFELLDAALTNLDENSLLAKNAVSLPGISMLQDVVRAARQSLASGHTSFPHVTPAFGFDLKAFFDNPRDPKSLSVPPLRFSEECDADVCSSTTDIDPAFLDGYFEGSTDVDWEGEYTWTDEDAISDAIEELSKTLSRRIIGAN